MDGATRRNRFEARVSLERDFLTRVNAAFGDSQPLAGMTWVAIEFLAPTRESRVSSCGNRPRRGPSAGSVYTRRTAG